MDTKDHFNLYFYFYITIDQGPSMQTAESAISCLHKKEFLKILGTSPSLLEGWNLT
jgi:hypothetical protein